MSTPTLEQLKRAVTISEQIEKLQQELAGIFGKQSATVSKPVTAATDGRRAKKSPETIAKMKAAQQARYAKLRGAKAKAPAKAKGEAPAKTKRTMSPEAKAKIAAAMKARWDAAKAGKAPAPNAGKKKK